MFFFHIKTSMYNTAVIFFLYHLLEVVLPFCRLPQSHQRCQAIPIQLICRHIAVDTVSTCSTLNQVHVGVDFRGHPGHGSPYNWETPMISSVISTLAPQYFGPPNIFDKSMPAQVHIYYVYICDTGAQNSSHVIFCFLLFRHILQFICFKILVTKSKHLFLTEAI